MWDRLVSGRVIEEFGHAEVDSKSGIQPPSRDVMQNLFRDARDEPCVATPAATSQEKARVDKSNKLLEEARFVKDEKLFSACTPESEQTLTAELVFIRLLHEHNLWHKVGDAWVTGMLPKGQLVRFKRYNTHAFVLKTYVVAALCWPAEMASPNMWRKARD